MTDKALEAMTAPLDEKAVELAAREIAANDWSVDSNMTKREWQDKRWIYHRDDAEAAIRAYLAASPSPSELEVVAWLDETADAAPGAKGVTTDAYTAAYWEHTSDAPMTELVRASQAQSALAAIRAEREEARLDRITAERDAQNMANRLVAAEARVKDAMGLLDHLIGWIVHDCGAEPPFTSEQDETYAALKGPRP